MKDTVTRTGPLKNRKHWYRPILVGMLLATVLGFGFFSNSKVAHAISGIELQVSDSPYKCLDADANHIGNGDKVQLWKCWNGSNQQWFVDWGNCTTYQDGVNYCEIRSAADNSKCLDANGQNPGAGSVVQLWDCWGGWNQKWGIYTNPSGTLTIFLLAGNNLVLDATQSCVTNDGCQVQVYTALGNGNQHWFWN